MQKKKIPCFQGVDYTLQHYTIKGPFLFFCFVLFLSGMRSGRQNLKTLMAIAWHDDFQVFIGKRALRISLIISWAGVMKENKGLFLN